MSKSPPVLENKIIIINSVKYQIREIRVIRCLDRKTQSFFPTKKDYANVGDAMQ